MAHNYSYTNKFNQTTRIYVWEITEKSVYYVWANENGTPKSTLIKLDNKIRNIIEYLSFFPELGVAYKSKNARILYKDNYSILYRIEKEDILILQIWDTRQNPKNLPL